MEWAQQMFFVSAGLTVVVIAFAALFALGEKVFGAIATKK